MEDNYNNYTEQQNQSQQQQYQQQHQQQQSNDNYNMNNNDKWSRGYNKQNMSLVGVPAKQKGMCTTKKVSVDC